MVRHQVRRPYPTGWWLAAIGLAMAALAGCTNDGEDDDTLRDAGIYSSVVGDLAQRSGMAPDEDDPPILFIEALDPNGIVLPVQVEVVAGFIELYEVRFIDDRVEAIEVDLPERPVRSEGLLIGLGSITIDGTPRVAEVRGELYLSQGEVRAYRYTLSAAGDGWEVAEGGPESIDPEGFVASS